MLRVFWFPPEVGSGGFFTTNHSPMRFVINLLDNIAYLLVLLLLGIYLLIFKVPGIVADFIDEEILNYD
jgi:uncharacterized membrane protein